MRFTIGILKMIQVAIYARHALLIVGRIGEVHAVFLMTVDTQCRYVIGGGFTTLYCDFLQGGAMWIMACGAIHTALVVRAYLPVLPAKACIAVAAPTQIR